MNSPTKSIKDAELIIGAAILDMKDMVKALEDNLNIMNEDEIWDAAQGLLGIGNEVSQYGNCLLKSHSEIEEWLWRYHEAQLEVSVWA